MVNDSHSVHKYEDTYLPKVYCEKDTTDAKLYKVQEYSKPTKQWSKKDTFRSLFEEVKHATWTPKAI